MEEIPIYHGSKLNVDGIYSSQVCVVFSERNILSRIAEDITKDVDRMNFALTCKYFYNYMFNTSSRKTYMPRRKFHLNISFLRKMNVLESCPYYGKKETENVIQFDTSGGCTYVWNYNHIVYEGSNENFGSICLGPYFNELNWWISLHSQLVTHVRIDYEVGCKSLFYKEIVSVLFDKLVNLRKISMDSNLFYVISRSFFYDLQTLKKDDKNVILEISAGSTDNGGITRKFNEINTWLTPEHHVELIPKTTWSYYHHHFKCPLVSVSAYKYFRKIHNVSTFDFYMFLGDQKMLEDVFVLCDSRTWFQYYDNSYSLDSLRNVSKFSFCCNNQNHYGCGLGILSLFPLEDNCSQNFNLRELSFSIDAYCKFKIYPSDMRTISKIFPNISLLTIPGSAISQSLKSIFNNFHHLKDILIWNVSLEQLEHFIDFASNFSEDNYLIRTLYFISEKMGFYLNVEHAIKLKKKFKYFEVDNEPVNIVNGEFVEQGVNDFTLRRKKSYKEYKHVNSVIRMSNSAHVLEKFVNIISPRFY